MSEINNHQEHMRIAGLVPDGEQLAVSQSNSLGSFVLNNVNTGDFVPLSERRAIEADFDVIPELTANSIRSNFDRYQQEFDNDPRKVALRAALEVVPDAQRNTFMAALYGVEVARQFFGDKLGDKEKRDKLGWRAIDETREDSYLVKKLSDTKDEGVCVEYSLFVGEVMKQLGVDARYTVGFRQDWSEEPGFCHAFLTIDDTRGIIDPYLLAQSYESGMPYGLAIAPGDGSIALKPDQAVSYIDIFDRSKIYSATPIAANGVALAA